MKKTALFLIFSLLITIMGCESNMLKPLANDSSKQADIEEAKMALDDGNYDKAISALHSYNNTSDPEVAGIQASAYMGKAGLDLTYILEHTNADNADNFNVIASALSLETTNQLAISAATLNQTVTGEDTANGFITNSSIDRLLTNLAQAEAILSSLPNKTDDSKVQLGIASALHFILQLGDIIAEVKQVNIPITIEAYKQVFPTAHDWDDLEPQVISYLGSHPDVLTSLKTDLINIYAAVKVFIVNIGITEDITKEFSRFITDLLDLPEGSNDSAITAKINSYSASDISIFISNKILGY